MNWEKINKFRRLCRTSWLKSAFLNFSLLPWKQAIKFPIIVSKYTYFYSLSGKIELMQKAQFGMIRIGFLGEDVVVPKNERSLLQIEGKLILGVNVRLGCGVIIRVEPDATLKLDTDVRIGSKCRIIAYKDIYIGKNTGLSWECQVLDSDMHQILDLNSNKILREYKTVFIGNNNWIGARTMIMKGTKTPDFTIISAGSYCNKNYNIPEYSIIGGQPAHLIKNGFVRKDYIK